jgi:hypothetical protein
MIADKGKVALEWAFMEKQEQRAPERDAGAELSGGTKGRTASDGISGLEQARRAHEALIALEESIFALPDEFAARLDTLMYGKVSNDPAFSKWVVGLQRLLSPEFEDTLEELFSRAADADILLDSLWVSFRTLHSDGTESFDCWTPLVSPQILQEHAAEVVNLVNRARRLAAEWDWQAEPAFETSAAFSRDSIAWNVVHHCHQLLIETRHYLGRFQGIAVRVDEVRTQNAWARDMLELKRQTASGSPDKSGGRPSKATPVEHVKNRISATSWTECKLILGENIVATTKSGGRREIVRHVKPRIRNALELLHSHGETDFEAPSPSRKRTIASEVRAFLKVLFDVPGGDPVPSVGRGKYTLELVLKGRDDLSERELQDYA